MSSPRPPARGRFNTWIVLLATIVILVVVALLALGNRGPGASPSASPSRSKTSEPTATSSPSGSPASPGASSTATGTTQLTVGLGYIPNVQFAPFYLANQAGYYEDAGLQVTFENKIDPDLITLVGQGSIDIGLADGTSMIPAVSQGIPVRYLATVYRAFPSIVFTKTSSGITKAADLKGKKLGIPGRYGSSWIMLQALLKSANLTPDDLQIVEYPDFGQAAAVQQGAVDAATGFVNNEPVQLKEDGVDVRVLTVDQFVPLPGPGLIAGTKTLESKETRSRRSSRRRSRRCATSRPIPSRACRHRSTRSRSSARTRRRKRRCSPRRSPRGRVRATSRRSGRSIGTPGRSRSTSCQVSVWFRTR